MPTALSSAAGHDRRHWWPLAGLVAVLAGLLVWQSGLLDGSPRSSALETRAMVSGLPSLIESAIARTDPAAQQASVIDRAGLQLHRLTGDHIDELTPLMGAAEARLIDIYQHIGRGEHRQALRLAEQLVAQHPNYQLAQLVLGDLLSLQVRPVSRLGDVPDTKAAAAMEQLDALREESRRRLRALTERPPEGSIPAQFLALAPQSRHAIAVDASRSRLYLFENQGNLDGTGTPRMRLLGDFYISVGLSGIDKEVEGDRRTPLGVYYITSNLDPRRLPDLYGAGALPINYPNPLDLQRGKTGSGIWLHGTPSEQFVRAPLASDGCVVLSNPDLERLLRTVQIRTTPVVIAEALQWVSADALSTRRASFESALESWRIARSEADTERLREFYSSRFRAQGRDLTDWWARAERDLLARGARDLELKDLSILNWQDADNTMVVTFGEVPRGSSRGVTRRQYWILEQDGWKIFHEGNA
ncbi:MAG TPA: L,D-transpeptidase family protein [Hydrogenophaga sp.]|uniref:L,D-transpeptidase family protein n=1 Tax=Hydrogenophaga sp. TaxID=1904254 RepID=UPI002C06A76C|nr:L,D-transpeptidase family protein [Hydrogenophaga sp.]HMN92994.1 L,D-transpeptidase family protein [Hydrogenophaga sp.]HMP09120.1 L,D-transpeptidase family protein [Hydrogenophaga sp.]